MPRRGEGGISFVFREQAMRVGESKKRTIVPGKPDESELIVRITSPDEKLRMPRAEHGPRLTPTQIDLLRQWIAEGALWSEYWAFVAPKSYSPPAVKMNGWVRGPLDRFVLARLEHERFAPAPESGKAELLRRVSFDLIGLPPTVPEQEDFVADISPKAFEKQVERLLASPGFKDGFATRCRETDRAIGALLTDLEERGLMDDTLVVWGGEFGRTPMQETRGGRETKFVGRDHHPGAFTVWLAGGGVKPGFSHGETDEMGYEIVKDPVEIRDLHATILHQLGFNHSALAYPFQGLDQKLTGVKAARVVNQILA